MQLKIDPLDDQLYLVNGKERFPLNPNSVTSMAPVNVGQASCPLCAKLFPIVTTDIQYGLEYQTYGDNVQVNVKHCRALLEHWAASHKPIPLALKENGREVIVIDERGAITIPALMNEDEWRYLAEKFNVPVERLRPW
jgi:hypothetical protein